MPICYVENCDSGTAAQLLRDGEKRNFFSPCTDEMIRSWSNVIGRENKTLTKMHKVCQLHFAESDVETHFVHKFPDGTIQKLKRGRASLKKGSIPIKTSSQEFGETCQSPQKLPINCEDLNIKSESPNSLNGNLSYDFILENCNSISSELNSWSVTIKNDYILWTYFEDEEQFICKFVKLEPDLKLTVYIGKTKLSEVCKIKSTEELLMAFDAVSNLLPCIGASLEKPEVCEGYVFRKQNNIRGRQIKLCTKCRRYRLALRKRDFKRKMRLQKLRKVIEVRRTELKLMKRKLLRLQTKVANLQKKLLIARMTPKKEKPN